MRLVLASACLLIAACSPSERPASASQPEREKELFQQTVTAHVDAIRHRDLAALMDTITDGENLVLIFPDATTYYTRQQYVDFHREWFAEQGWTMQMEPVSVVLRDGLGVALMRTTYTDAAGPRKGLLALTFGREQGRWRLVFDQNTRIVEK
jgi:ketosteroid isomerase-like protein